MRVDVPDERAAQLTSVARQEPATQAFQTDPVHAGQYASLIGGRVRSGPAFTFPDAIVAPRGIVEIRELGPLERNFRGWSANEIPECSPILAVMEHEDAISVCFCARRSAHAAEAGVETAAPFRGLGLAPRVTAAWALAVRASGRLPIYSTSWTNQASLSVARKLGLKTCASNWSLSD